MKCILINKTNWACMPTGFDSCYYLQYMDLWYDFRVVLQWYDLLYKIYYFNLAMVMFIELCNFVFGYIILFMNYDQRNVKDHMDGHDASSHYL